MAVHGVHLSASLFGCAHAISAYQSSTSLCFHVIKTFIFPRVRDSFTRISAFADWKNLEGLNGTKSCISTNHGGS